MHAPVAVAMALVLAAGAPALADNYRTPDYVPNAVLMSGASFIVLGPWDAPAPEKWKTDYDWGSYLVMAETPIRLNRYGQTATGAVLLPASRSGGDIDCINIGHPVLVGANDPNHLDGDHDGVGCEDW